jgi:threonylcarbamoyladenosine tRNA methylthiotransferase MtaB
VINTCSVTEKSNYRCRQLIRKTVDSNPESFVVVVGCYPQLDSKAVKSVPGVDLILGNDEKLDIVKYLKNLNVIEEIPKKNSEPLIVVGRPNEETVFRSEEVNHFAGKTKAFLKIQTGCNFKCSFCVITLARGQSRSAEVSTVVRQFKKLLENGFKEITLTGIHLGSYGKDLSSPTNLCKLLKELIKIKENFRIRLSSLGPKDISDELIGLIAAFPKICNHLHISLQSGSDKILRLMKRNYRMVNVYDLMNKITGRITNIGIGADLIAGFPGEGDKEFEETLSMVHSLPFSYLHVFNFSRRKNTVAYDLPDQVPNRIRKERVSILKDLARQKSLNFKESFLEKKLNVLIEQNRDPITEMLKGYTGNYIPVHVPGTDDLINQIVLVRMSHLESDTLFGVYSG